MKKEKGSALLTTILIIFVLTTIGSALGSFVVYNYKLREYDNKIGRAEYETEKAVDALLVRVKQNYKDLLADARTKVETVVNDAYKDAIKKNQSIDVEKTVRGELYKYLTNSQYIDNIKNISNISVDSNIRIDNTSLTTELTEADLYSGKIVNKIIITHTGTRPEIVLSFTITFGIPTLQTLQGDYDIDKYVNIIDYTMQNWGYL
jgi:membrane-associated HD superfamily phosphohydrolase